MTSSKAKARMGAKGAVVMTRHPTLRRATWLAAKPSAKVGWRVGKVVVRRKASARIERIEAAGRNVASIVAIYGPMAAEVFGLVEPPKPRRRGRVFAAGVVVGAVAMYVLNRRNRG